MDPEALLLGNSMQRSAAESLTAMEAAVRAARRPSLTAAWRRLGSAGHFRWMHTHADRCGPHASAYDAYINHANMIDSLRDHLAGEEAGEEAGQAPGALPGEAPGATPGDDATD